MDLATERSARRILVVDDNPWIRLTAAEFLREEGYLVTEATDGAEALETFDECGADLVLMDIQMVGMDGIDAATVFHERAPLLPIFAFTAMPQVVDGCHSLFAAVLVKPMPLSKLCRVLDSYFRDTVRH